LLVPIDGRGTRPDDVLSKGTRAGAQAKFIGGETQVHGVTINPVRAALYKLTSH
jgi:hypothetical protein